VLHKISCQLYQKIKVTVHDVLPSDATPLLIVKSLWGLGNQRLNFDGFIYIRYTAPPYCAGTLIIASVYGGWIKNSGHIFRHLAHFRRVENRPKQLF